MRKKVRVTYQISFNLPPNCPVYHATNVLKAHLRRLGGDLRPPGSFGESDEGDPMFALGSTSTGRLSVNRIVQSSSFEYGAAKWKEATALIKKLQTQLTTKESSK